MRGGQGEGGVEDALLYHGVCVAVGGYGDFYEEVVFGEGGGGFDLEEVGVGLVFSFFFLSFFFFSIFSFIIFVFFSYWLEGMSRRGKGRKEGSLVCLQGDSLLEFHMVSYILRPEWPSFSRGFSLPTFFFSCMTFLFFLFLSFFSCVSYFVFLVKNRA